MEKSDVGDSRFGAKRWKHEFENPIRDAFVITGGALFVATTGTETQAMLYAVRED